ncbi:DUF3540 domain-containing protein [Paraneptunicella aestuarii]|uniref:DUF3540 domain-containing protein n=1 Tax=Paraneptunicella aestuarii TaxID=2831148 RepID=UPI001E342414|nr:DUF3540 domain-containing protein [Paraneptunicella aestuarii]UAA37093.1 DUF3540 domain-containing protein [Paraneptunicella aestuarii]
MNQLNNTYNVTPLPVQPALGMKSGVISYVEGNVYVIDGTLPAQQALSCLIKPTMDDKVLYCVQGDECWILAVLYSTNQGNAAQENTEQDSREIALPNRAPMQMNTRKLTVNASEQIDMNSMGDINLNSVMGKLSMSAKRCYQTIQDSFIQLAKHIVHRGEYIDHQADKLLKTHAAQHLMTADNDIKIDAERINMG